MCGCYAYSVNLFFGSCMSKGIAMNERTQLLETIANLIADYREGQLAAPSPQHVERWVNQFASDVQLPILKEMSHVLTKTYITHEETCNFVASLFDAKKLIGTAAPCDFWKEVKFLNIQGGGSSQQDMRELFSQVLFEKCALTVDECGVNPTTFVYLDDAIFSGGRVKQDLVKWINNDAPDRAIVHVIVMATHQGFYYNKNKIAQAVTDSGKTIKIQWWRSIELENRKKHSADSDVLWPVAIPADPMVQMYVEQLRTEPPLRDAGKVGSASVFSSDEGRQLLEQEFLKAGMRIRNMCPNFNQYQRPLGYQMFDSLGFGSLIVTFRNCPNNAPLALWAGHPWYPLFQRAIN